jgi:hypothetical protein
MLGLLHTLICMFRTACRYLVVPASWLGQLHRLGAAGWEPWALVSASGSNSLLVPVVLALRLVFQQLKLPEPLALYCNNTATMQGLSSAHSMDIGSAGGVSLAAAAAAGGAGNSSAASPVWFCGAVLPDDTHTGKLKLLHLQSTAEKTHAATSACSVFAGLSVANL